MSENNFEGLADAYAAYRPGLPVEVASQIIGQAQASGVQDLPLLDLGTGTGQVIAALGHAFIHCIGVDAEHDMLVKARE